MRERSRPRSRPTKWAIGVDSDQYLLAKPDEQKHILTSMIKRVDVAVFETIKAVADGDTKGGIITFDLKSDGVGYCDLRWLPRRHQGQARRVQGRHHQRQDRGSHEALTSPHVDRARARGDRAPGSCVIPA